MKWLLVVPVLVVALFLTAFWHWIAHHSSFRGNWKQIKAPLVIFDFDGTICPSYPLFIDQLNLLADEYKLKKVDVAEAESLKGMTPRSIMKMLGVSLFKLPFLLKKARRNVQRELLELEPVPGMVDLLQELKDRQYVLGILTSNSLENVLLYLRRYQIDLFDFVFTGNNVFGKEKHLKRILEKAHLDPERDVVIYIGDEIRDMEASQKAGFMSIGVTWGYNSLELLQESHPDFLAKEPFQILSIVCSQK